MPVILTALNWPDDLNTEIARTARLLADLRYLRDHGLPPDDVLAEAPVIDNHATALRLVTCLRGYVFGHPEIRNGRLAVTSPVRVLAPDHGFLRTDSRFYRLGRPGTEDRFDA